MYDFRKIEAFCRVYEQRSFSKAGEVLFLSQPTVSAHVQALENEMGVRLLDRLGRTVLPTPAGVVLYRHSVRAFEELDAAKNEISSLMGEVAGEVVLGASTIPAGFILPEVVTSFIKKHPKSSLNLLVKDSHAVIKSVLSCEVMLGVVGAAEKHPDLEFTHLVDDELIVVGSPSLKPAGENRKKYTMSEASTWPWVIRNEGSGTRKSFEEGLVHAGYSPRELKAELKVDSTQAAVQYAQAGLGVTVTSRLGVSEQLASGSLVEFRLQGVKLPRRFYAVQNLRRGFFPAVASFLSHLSERTAHLRAQE